MSVFVKCPASFNSSPLKTWQISQGMSWEMSENCTEKLRELRTLTHCLLTLNFHTSFLSIKTPLPHLLWTFTSLFLHRLDVLFFLSFNDPINLFALMTLYPFLHYIYCIKNNLFCHTMEFEAQGFIPCLNATYWLFCKLIMMVILISRISIATF